MTFAHYALIVTMSLQFSIGVIAMMWENSKAEDFLMYMAMVITAIGLLIVYFGR